MSTAIKNMLHKLFHFHQWSKWRETRQIESFDGKLIPTLSSRHCKKCFAVDTKRKITPNKEQHYAIN